MNLLTYKKVQPGTYECKLKLNELFNSDFAFRKFNKRWTAFLNSDPWNKKVFKRDGNIIEYSHKSWVPEKADNRTPILFLAGNPAPQSTYKDIYYAFEMNGTEHRFWKVLRKLGFIDLPFNPQSMKATFFGLNYASPFRVGIDVALTFPSSASAPTWSGVQGLQKLFGGEALKKILFEEKIRLDSLVNNFFKDSPVRIIAVQKNAYDMFAKNIYSLKKAVMGQLISTYHSNGKEFKIYGTPPTRWLYTVKMQAVLLQIKEDILKKDKQIRQIY